MNHFPDQKHADKVDPMALEPDPLGAARTRFAQLLGKLLARHWLRTKSKEADTAVSPAPAVEVQERQATL